MNKPTLDALPTYQHTQRGPWSFVLLAVVASNLTLAVRLWGNEPAWASWLFLSVALLMTFMTLCFQSLTTTVSETSLRVHFGPIPLLEKRFCWKRLFPFAQKKQLARWLGSALDLWQRLDLQHVGFRLPCNQSGYKTFPSGNQRPGPALRSLGKSHIGTQAENRGLTENLQ